MKKILLSFLASCAFVCAGAAPVSSLKSLCGAGKTIVVTASTVIEGVVVSDWRSANMELNPNISYAEVDTQVNDRTAYLQDADGSAGVRLVFADPSDNQLCRYDRVSIDIAGCTLVHSANPDRVTVKGLTHLNVISYSPGTPEGVTVKEKYCDELTDSDIYTLVTLKDLEFAFKDGSYTDIYEGYAQDTPGYSYSEYYPNRRMDGWATLLRDGRGGAIYMLVNTLCTWRRNNTGLPQGIGPVRGIIVHTPMRRYGGNMGRYSIRPMDESDILVSKKKASAWKCLTGWALDGSAGNSMEFETLGTQTDLFKNGKKGDRVLSDTGGQGFFWTDSESYIHIDNDFTRWNVESRGAAINSSIMLRGKTSGWFVFGEDGKTVRECRSIFVEFNAKKVKGGQMQFCFSWMEGTSDANKNYNYPAEWKVQMTTDEGAHWVTLKETATGAEKIYLRTHPWWDKKLTLAGGGTKRTGYDCGLGMQQRCFTIPASAAGQKSVILRLTPASPALAAIRSKPEKSVLDPAGKPSAKMKNDTWIRFGRISVDYLQ